MNANTRKASLSLAVVAALAVTGCRLEKRRDLCRVVEESGLGGGARPS